MKKSLVIILLLFFGLSVFVSSLMTRTDTDSLATKVNYDVTVQINKGWNLVVLSPVWGSGDRPGAIKEDSEIKQEDIKAAFYYSREDNKYLQLYPSSSDVENYLSVAQNNQTEMLYFAQAPVWVYSDKTGILKYSREDFPKFDSSTRLPLNAGWNFVTITPEMTIDINKASSTEEAIYTLNSYKGDCNFEKVYHFEQTIQQWSSNLANDNFMNEELESGIAGLGLLVKVSSDCQLGEVSSNINPPAIPVYPDVPGMENKTCSRLDGGQDPYYFSMVGEINYRGLNYVDFCVKEVVPSSGEKPMQIFINVENRNSSTGRMGYEYTGVFESVDPTCSGDNCYLARTTCRQEQGFYEIIKCDYCARGNCRIN